MFFCKTKKDINRVKGKRMFYVKMRSFQDPAAELVGVLAKFLSSFPPEPERKRNSASLR